MKYITLLFLLFFTTSSYAQETQILIGGEFSQTKGEWNDYTGEWEDSFGLRVGTETDESRIYLTYNYVEINNFLIDIFATKTDYTSHQLTLNFDAKTEESFGFLQGFVGVNLGGIYSQWELNAQPLYPDRDDLDFIFGAQAGVIANIMRNLYLEAGFKYSLTNAGNDSINPATVMAYYGAINLKF